jgi:tetratricopeptide (TPR) repeat protein
LCHPRRGRGQLISNLEDRSAFDRLAVEVLMARYLTLSCAALVCMLHATLRADDAGNKTQSDEMVPLIEGLGDLDHRVTTSKPLAQQYFNQGLRLIFAFNHDEAIRAFQAAAKIDPDCAMAYWGIALAKGPNYNMEAEKERNKAAYDALQQAVRLAPKVSPVEAAYIGALSYRYGESPDADRKPLDLAYSIAMRQLSKQYPDDLDAAVLFAESMMDLRPWDLWSPDGQPREGTEEIVATLESVLKRNSNHPGANHFYIHAVEASSKPERGLDCALRLGGLMPGAGHMIHMPSHIFMRTGRYDEAAESNRRAIEVDQRYIEKLKPEGMYPMFYYPHTIHFLWYALCMDGRQAEAIEAADKVVALMPAEMVKDVPMIEAMLPTRLFALVRFRQWEDIFREKPPAEDLTYATGMWLYARTLAYSATGQKHLADDHRKQLEAIIEATPEDKKFMRHSAKQLLRIAALHADGVMEARAHKIDAAVERFGEAIRLEDQLLYDEPPAWFFPERQALGSVLLEAGRASEAERLFREDLKLNPENGWSLSGLARSLHSQKRTREADEVQARFVKAWAGADAKPD